MSLVVTLGDPAGIGTEVILKSWLMREEYNLPPFAVLGCSRYFKDLARRMDWPLAVHSIETVSQAKDCFAKALPVLDRPLPFTVVLGKPDVKMAAYIIDILNEAATLCIEGQAMGMVTAPIHKATLYSHGFEFAGHTEFLEQICGNTQKAVMMLTIDDLRVIPVTSHVPLMTVGKLLTIDRIVEYGLLTHDALRQDYGISAPRLALAALNPHAGEEGTIGHEEIDIIIPAARQLRAKGVNITDPLPCDTLFHDRARLNYDAVICMYHDQALIPIKTLDFDSGVNVTLNLPLVRTSPDHGTAFDIAPQGIAFPNSFAAAVCEAEKVSQNRLDFFQNQRKATKRGDF